VHQIYVAAEGIVLCDLSKSCKVADAIVLLSCIYFVFNFDYAIQRNVSIFFQAVMMSSTRTKLPVSVAQLISDLQAES